MAFRLLEDQEEIQTPKQGKFRLLEEPVEPENNRKEDFISKNLREQGYEPDFSEEIERLTQQGGPDLLKGMIHSATTGGALSYLTGEPEEQKTGAYQLGELTGSFAPIEGIAAFYGPKLLGLAKKSPYAQKALEGLARMTGMGLTGATYETAEKLNEGEIPSVDDVVKHGAQWAALDGFLQLLGKTGSFAKNLLSKSKQTGEPQWKILNDVLDKASTRGEITDVKTAEKAFDILSKEVESGGKSLEGKKVEAKPIHRVSEESPSLAEPYKPGEFKAENVEQKLLKEESERFKGETEKHEKATEQHKKETELSKEEAKLEEELTLETEEAALKKETEESLNKISPREESKQDLGSRVQKSVEKYLEEAEKIYEPLYEEAGKIQKTVKYKPTQTISVLKNILEELGMLETKPKGYEEVISSAKKALTDLGYTETAKIGGSKFKLPSPISIDIPLPQMAELAKRLNKIAKYDIVGPDIGKQLNRVAASLKEEIRFATELANPKAGKAFSQAEAKYGETAQNLKRHFVHKARGQQAPEKIIEEVLKSPTGLADLKKLLDAKDFAALEREILEHLKTMKPEKGQEYLREYGKHLSPKANQAGKQIINNKLNPPKVKKIEPKEIAEPIKPEKKKVQLTNKQARKDAIEKEIEKAFEEGKRPKKTMDLWHTQEGQKLIKEALKGNPHEKEILEYLNKQSFHDFLTSVIGKDGKINFKEFNKYLRDPALADTIKMIGGPNALSTFKTLESMANKMEKNAKIFESLKEKGEQIATPSAKHGENLIKKTGEKYTAAQKKLHPIYEKFKELDKFLGNGGKSLLTLFGIIPHGSVLPGAAYLGAKMMFKITQNTKIRNAFIKAANANPHNKASYIKAIEELSKLLDEEEK